MSEVQREALDWINSFEDLLRMNKITSKQVAVILGNTSFKVGDYVIAHKVINLYNHEYKIGPQLFRNDGAPRKYKIVFVDKLNIPYARPINKAGKLYGWPTSPVYFDNWNSRLRNSYIHFKIDPDYLDSTLFDETENFDPAAAAKECSTKMDEIKNHNNSVRVSLSTNKEVIDYLTSLKVGDVVWKSPKKFYTIVELNKFELTPKTKRVKLSSTLGKIKDERGEEYDLKRSFFNNRLYSSQPLSRKGPKS